MKGLTTAVVLLAAMAAQADCVSSTDLISARSSVPNRAAGPIAWSGSQLAVAKYENATKAIYIGVYDGDGRFVRDTKVVDSAAEGPVSLLWTGSDFGLFFSPVGRLHYQRVAADGRPIGGTVELTHNIFPDDEFDFAWDPTRQAHLVLHRVTQGPEVGLWLSGIAADGSVKFDRLLYTFLAGTALPRIAPATNGVISIFFNHASVGGTSMLRVDAQDRYVAPVTVAPTTPLDIAVAPRGTQIGLARQVPLSGGRTEIRWTVVDTNAATIVSDRSLVTPTGTDVAPVALIAAPDEWALAYDDSPLGFRNHPGEYRLQRFTQSGAVLSNTIFSVERVRATILAKFPFIYNGSAYVSSVARFISTTEGTDSYLLRHCPLISQPLADRTVVRLLETINFTAIASGGSNGYRYEWDFGDHSRTDTGATIAHRYDRWGTYVVTLTTVDDAGGRSISTVTVNVVPGKNRAVR